MEVIDSVDMKAETTPLTASEREALKEANEIFVKLIRDEESKWAQKSKVRHIQDGGNNNKYFLTTIRCCLGRRPKTTSPW
jgi:hypothetical protein